MVRFSISFSVGGTISSFLSKVLCFQLQPFQLWLLLAGSEDDSGLACIQRRLESCFSWAKYSLVHCLKISGNEADLRKAPVAKFALIVGVSETRLAAIELMWLFKLRWPNTRVSTIEAEYDLKNSDRVVMYCLPKSEVDNNHRDLHFLGPVLESPCNFLGPESCFVFVVFAFKIQV